jgi:hypothetical protein
MVSFNTLKLSRVSPPKNVRWALFGFARFLQHEVDARLGGLDRHELRLRAVFGVDDLVLAVLVAVGAREVALVGDVEHHGAERHRRQRQDLRHRLRRFERTDRPHRQQFADRFVHFLIGVDTLGQREQVGPGLRPRTEHLHHHVGGRVEADDRGTGHQIEVRLPCRFEPVMFPNAKTCHLPTSDAIQRM